jgi:hypothetical protein
MKRALYWFVTGACLGFGLIAILSIGFLFLLAGMTLVTVGAIRVGARGLWAGLVGFGLLPALLLLYDLSGPIEPASTAQSYRILAIGFGTIAGLGLILALMLRLSHWRDPSLR